MWFQQLCCEECSIGKWTGESAGSESCGSPSGVDASLHTALRNNAFHQCCMVNWIHAVGNICQNSIRSLCKIFHFYSYIWNRGVVPIQHTGIENKKMFCYTQRKATTLNLVMFA